MNNNELFHAHMANIKAKSDELEWAIKEFKSGWESAGGSRMKDLTTSESMMASSARQTISMLTQKWEWPF